VRRAEPMTMNSRWAIAATTTLLTEEGPAKPRPAGLTRDRTSFLCTLTNSLQREPYPLGKILDLYTVPVAEPRWFGERYPKQAYGSVRGTRCTCGRTTWFGERYLVFGERYPKPEFPMSLQPASIAMNRRLGRSWRNTDSDAGEAGRSANDFQKTRI